MIICICRRVSDRDIASAVHQGGCTRFEDLQHRLGVATGCGACRDCARQTFEAMATSAADGTPLAGHHAPVGRARTLAAAAQATAPAAPAAPLSSVVPSTAIGSLVRADASGSIGRRSLAAPADA